MYQAIITKIKLLPHPNADRLALANVSNYQVVVGKDSYTEGQLVIFFPEDGQLSEEFCSQNNLYRKGEGTNKDPNQFGYFDANRRIRSIKLRGEISEGFLIGLDSLEYTGVDLSSLKQGMLINNVNEHEICGKYVTPATKNKSFREASKHPASKRPIDEQLINFHKIGETGQLKFTIDHIPKDSVITISEKIHGTSGRTTNLAIEKKIPRTWWQKLLHYPEKVLHTSILVSGTRNTIIEEKQNFKDSQNSYRHLIHSEFKDKLYIGETVYYEIVVCNKDGISNFRQNINPDNVGKALLNNYSTPMNYKYGCKPNAYKFFIYKITMQNNHGNAIRLSWNQMITRANELGMQVVPHYTQFIYDGNKEALLDEVENYAKGPSILDSSHIREGVVLYIDGVKMNTVLKYKNFEFRYLEGIAKNDDTLVDVEEAE